MPELYQTFNTQIVFFFFKREPSKKFVSCYLTLIQVRVHNFTIWIFNCDKQDFPIG